MKMISCIYIFLTKCIREWTVGFWCRYTGPRRCRYTCLATDASLTANPRVASSIPTRSHTFVEIDCEIISTVFHLPSAESFKKDCCQLQAKVCA